MPQASQSIEPFKNAYSPSKVAAMAATLERRVPEFEADRFVAGVSSLEQLEMKARVDLITRSLHSALPLPYPEAVSRLVGALGDPGAADGKDHWGPDNPRGGGLSGFEVWPLTHFVALFGLEHHQESMAALAQMTTRWTAEFALRPFLVADPEGTLAELQEWTRSPDQHLRRAASESTRPRLPWGMRLRGFVADPAPVLGLIETLRDDPSEYVRRSVANNLNDIGKDHPEVLVEVARRWWAEGSDRTRKLVKHALRSLVKAGDPAALQVLGFTVPAAVAIDGPHLSRPTLSLGESQVVTALISSTVEETQRVVVDVVLHLIGARGQDREKVFKGRTFTLKPGATEAIDWALAIRPISTRAYYPGRHGIELLVCGERCGRVDFELLVPGS